MDCQNVEMHSWFEVKSISKKSSESTADWTFGS
jgi:hypothetical protein